MQPDYLKTLVGIPVPDNFLYHGSVHAKLAAVGKPEYQPRLSAALYRAGVDEPHMEQALRSEQTYPVVPGALNVALGFVHAGEYHLAHRNGKLLAYAQFARGAYLDI